ncbi:hypothetical protein C8R44DRAFT_560497, partial [Mycena epipterygia]
EDDLKCFKDIGTTAENGRKDLTNSVSECQAAIENCLKADEDRYAAYGQNIQKVVEQINQTRWHGETPLGPFGIHVKLRDPKWAQLLRFQLQKLLCSFAITDAQDFLILKKILAESGNAQTTIHIFRPDLFDYSHGEPPAEVNTVLRVLEISDPHVLRIMINKAGIEARVLAPRRADAERVLVNMRSRTGWTLNGFNVIRY